MREGVEMQGRIAAWVFDNISIPSFLQPYVFGLIIGRWPHKIEGGDDA